MKQLNDSTHVVHLRQISTGAGATLLAKLEGRNFGDLRQTDWQST